MICWECEKEAEHLHNHHVVPRSRGGIKTVALCQSCHAKAHHRSKSMSTSQLTKEGLARKKAQGYILGRAPYGYKHNGDGSLVEIAEEQAIIARAIELRESGMSYRDIGKKLNMNNKTVAASRREPSKNHQAIAAMIRRGFAKKQEKL